MALTLVINLPGHTSFLMQMITDCLRIHCTL